MTGDEIEAVYNELLSRYSNGDQCSKRTIFLRAWADNYITELMFKRAEKYYGSQWSTIG